MEWKLEWTMARLSAPRDTRLGSRSRRLAAAARPTPEREGERRTLELKHSVRGARDGARTRPSAFLEGGSTRWCARDSTTEGRRRKGDVGRATTEGRRRKGDDGRATTEGRRRKGADGRTTTEGRRRKDDDGRTTKEGRRRTGDDGRTTATRLHDGREDDRGLQEERGARRVGEDEPEVHEPRRAWTATPGGAG